MLSCIRVISVKIVIICLAIGYTGCNKADINQANSIRVPFELVRNKVILPVSVNGSDKLNIILDTGMRFDGIYLFHEELVDKIDTTGAIEVRVPGAGAGEASTAVMIETGHIRFGDVEIDSQKVIISKSAHTQTFPTDGVIGWNLFGHYTVEINYDDEYITLHDTTDYAADPSWHKVPVNMVGGMPFFDCEVEVTGGDNVTMHTYIDLASGDALELLTGREQKFKMPENLEHGYLGTGLSGDIHGQRGVAEKLSLGQYTLYDITTLFAPAEVRSKQGNGDAILGNDVIRRFNIVFDYPRSRLLLKPSKYFDTPFN